MSPTQSAVTRTPSFTPSITPSTHRPSIPALVVLGLFLFMMAVLAVGVILRQRRETVALRHKQGISQDKQSPGLASWSSLPCFKFRSTAIKADTEPTAVGALHATSVLLAAAPCQVFSPPMMMHFKIPLEDKTILILGAPWFGFPVGCAARCCGGTDGED